MDDLDQIKSDPGCLRVYAKYIKGFKRAGDKYVGLCPFHQESSPSLTVFSDFRFHCFGCQATGNSMQFVERAEGCTFKEAVEIVKREIGGWAETKEKVESTFRPIAESKVYKTLDLAKWEKFEDALTHSGAALDWLDKERGIGPGTAQRLHLGFIQSIGNLAGEAGAEFADDGWIGFPCVSGDKILSVKYRSIAAKKFSRQPGMATALFNTEAVDPFEAIFIVEGEIDCLTLEQAGFRSVSVPSAGTKLTPDMKDTIMEASYVILAGDTDATGSAYLERLWKELGERTYLLKWPGVKDANEFFLKQCNRDVSIFRTKVEELTAKAKSTPLPDIYAIQEVMRNGEDTTLANREDRLRFPWKEVDRAAILLPGSLLGVMATQTGQGKSSFVLQYTLYGARKYNETVVNWQCEMTPSEIAVMVASQVLHKNRNFLTKEDMKLAADQLEGVQYFIGNNSTITDVMDVFDLIEAAVRRTGATQWVLDNAHYYCTGIDDEVRVLSAAIKRGKQLCVAYGCKGTIVFQPRKATQQGRGKKTHITDIRGSASAGDTTDAVVAIHRDLNKEDEKSDIYEEKTLVEWLKVRTKGLGKSSCFLHFFGEFCEFQAIESNYEEAPDDNVSLQPS
jgi:CHC2 zinc finger/Toprim-like/DnaB-like helicase C terminal domain